MDVDEGPSTRRLDLIPEPGDLLRRCRALALMDAAYASSPTSRWHIFEAHDSHSTCRASDGSGNEAVYWFGDGNAAIRGFDHESPISPWAQDPMAIWPGVCDGLPSFFRDQVPTIMVGEVESVTFCIWWSSDSWTMGPVRFPSSVHADPDGSAYFLKPLASVDQASSFLSEYYQLPVDPEAVAEVFAGRPLDARFARRLAPSATPADLVAEALRIGYPVVEELDQELPRDKGRGWFGRRRSS